jgi:hypothetical protein
MAKVETMFYKQLVMVISLWLLAHAAAWGQFDHSHAAWSALLKKHVAVIDGGKASRLRYAEITKDRAALKTYLETLANVGEADFRGWNKHQQLAFLLNAYNAHMVEKILLRYPNLKSVWDYGKVFGHPFKDKFFRLFGRDFALDNIEHDTIRAKGVYDEPRIHMALNCAAVGCPMLREEAYVADRLDAQLEDQVTRFLSDKSRNRYNPASNTLEVSEIFRWYSVDFTSGGAGIGGSKGSRSVTSREQFFSKYAHLLADTPEQQNIIRDGKAEIRHLDYDWGLNDARK